MKATKLKTRSNGAFRLVYHLVLSTKWRNKSLSSEILDYLEDTVKELLIKWDCELVEFGGESDHIHILYESLPSIDQSKLVNNIKTVTSRRCRKEFATHLKRFYWSPKPQFWARSYGLLTVGTTVSLDKLITYVQNQEKPVS